MKTKAVKRSEALQRQADAKKRSPREQWERLSERPGLAVKERTKLETKDATVVLELAS